jgi:PTS system galactitol-specific IIC component
MQQVMGIVNFILDLGPSVMMPIILFIMAVIFRVKFSKAIRGALTVGMGFIGINLVIGLLVGTLSPVTKAMVENFGLNLDVMDVGWPAASAIAFGTTSIVPWIFALGILLNFIMITFKWTKTLNIDMWNYWHFIFGSAFVYAATGSLPLAILIGLLTIVIVLKFADWTAPIVQNFFGLPGVSLPHTDTVSWAPIGWVINKLIDNIPVINEMDADPEAIQEKFGIIGEPIMIGTFIGLILGLLAYGPALAADMKGNIGSIINTAITLGAVMLIFPRMVRLLMEGLIPISEGVKEFLNKRFPGRELYIGLDAATIIGHPANVAVGLLLVPITILLAVLLSFIGANRILPFADLAVLPFFAIWATGWSKGNIVRGVIIGSVFMTGILIIGTFLAPMVTDLAVQADFAIPEGTNLISSLDVGAHLSSWVLMVPFVWGTLSSQGTAFLIFSMFFFVFAIFSYVIFAYKSIKNDVKEINEIEELERSWD